MKRKQPNGKDYEAAGGIEGIIKNPKYWKDPKRKRRTERESFPEGKKNQWT